MTAVRPLRLRLVRQSWAERVSSPAHDALTPSDRRAHLAFNPDSYMAVTRGLEDVAPGESTNAEDLLANGRAALDRLRHNGAFSTERGDDFYVYRLTDRHISMTGIVAGVSVADYVTGQVRIHEHVKANRAIHLANHLDVVGVQSSPIAMAHKPNAAIARLIERAVVGEPLLDFTLPDGLRQSVWAVTDRDDHDTMRSVLDHDPLYLIDGHHRAAAAATFRTAAGPGTADWMLSAIFSADELVNAPHHRVIRPSSGIDEAMRTIGRNRRVRQCTADEIDDRTASEIALYSAGQWYALDLPFTGGEGAQSLLDDLDPSRLQAQVLAPLLRIDPEGDDGSLGYLAGQRSLAELEKVVDEQEGLLAVMRQVPVSALVAAADAGLVMPPKSTYFEPKVRSGVFLRNTAA